MNDAAGFGPFCGGVFCVGGDLSRVKVSSNFYVWEIINISCLYIIHMSCLVEKVIIDNY